MLKDHRKRIAALDAQMERDNARMAELLELMADPDFYINEDASSDAVAEHSRLKQRLAKAEEEWFALTEELVAERARLALLCVGLALALSLTLSWGRTDSPLGCPARAELAWWARANPSHRMAYRAVSARDLRSLGREGLELAWWARADPSHAWFIEWADMFSGLLSGRTCMIAVVGPFKPRVLRSLGWKGLAWG